MHDYNGKVVAIAGAGNGLGKGMALRFADQGARLALADINAPDLARVEAELKAKGVPVITSCFDICDYAAVEQFARDTFEAYGEVDYLLDSAGIGSVGNIWKMPLNEWNKTFQINVMGFVNMIKAFIPAMIAQDKECYVINTASNAGLQAPGVVPAYSMSKHAAVSVTESLAIQLQMAKTKIKAYVFCPGFVVTELYNNTVQIRGNDDPYYQSEDYKLYDAIFRQGINTGISLEAAMDGFFKGLEDDKFYIRTHPNEEEDVRYRLDIVASCARPVPKSMR